MIFYFSARLFRKLNESVLRWFLHFCVFFKYDFRFSMFVPKRTHAFSGPSTAPVVDHVAGIDSSEYQIEAQLEEGSSKEPFQPGRGQNRTLGQADNFERHVKIVFIWRSTNLCAQQRVIHQSRRWSWRHDVVIRSASCLKHKPESSYVLGRFELFLKRW